MSCGRDNGTLTNAPLVESEPVVPEGNYLVVGDPNAPTVAVQHEGILLLDKCGDQIVMDRISAHDETWLGEEHRGCAYRIYPSANGVRVSKREFWDSTTRDYELPLADEVTLARALRARHQAFIDPADPLRDQAQGAIGRYFQAIFHYPIGRVDGMGTRPHVKPRHS